jgi:hypothetical protein
MATKPQPATVDQQIYLELKNITQVLGAISLVLGRLTTTIDEALKKKL